MRTSTKNSPVNRRNLLPRPFKKARVTTERANDRDARVRIEIRAAQIAPVGDTRELKIRDLKKCPWGAVPAEVNGWDMHQAGEPHETPILSAPILSARTEAGYLAREVATHEEREVRDAGAWAWDASHSVAGQYDEQLARTKSDAVTGELAIDSAVREQIEAGAAFICGDSNVMLFDASEEAPDEQAPDTEAPDEQAPDTEALDEQALDEQAPDVEAPDVEAPDTEAPDEQAPDTD
jgi:hypothetical protein